MAGGAGAGEHFLTARVRRDAVLVRGRRDGCGGCWQVGRGLWWHAAQISDDASDVLRRELAETVVDRFTHRTRRRAVARRMAERQIGDQVLVTPAAEAGGLVGGDVEGAPAGRDRARELLAVVQRKAEIARRVAFAAMRQRFNKIRAAIPLRALRRIRRKAC